MSHQLQEHSQMQTRRQLPSQVSSTISSLSPSTHMSPDLPTASQQSPTSPPTSSRAPTSRAPRGAKKVVLPTARLEPVEGSSDPLGPLSASQSNLEPDRPPSPPSKEQSLPTRNARQAPATPPNLRNVSHSRGEIDEDDASIASGQRPRSQGRSQTGVGEGVRRQIHPSVSIEQAARPTFNITVGDPHKVGDPISSHIVYQVRTKTTSKAYKQPDFSVSRRYRDFLWLYNTLHSNNPGIVAPPPPEKQAVGRFESNFVESRRAALERMLNKIAAHPILHHDADLKIFLESEAFNMDIKHREHREIGLGESKGVLSTFGLGSTSTGKFIEHDDWFHDRKLYLDALENQLKALLKSLDMVVGQRKALSEAAGDLSVSLENLANVEVSISLSTPLAGLADIQLRIRDLYDRQAQQDILTLGITIDEYVRIIGSVRTAFAQRQKSFHSWHNAESELQKRRTLQEKTLRSGKTQQDRLNQLQADVGDGERRCHQARLLFDDMGRLMRAELERFEREKVEDFKSGVETFLEGAIEAQKEVGEHRTFIGVESEILTHYSLSSAGRLF